MWNYHSLVSGLDKPRKNIDNMTYFYTLWENMENLKKHFVLLGLKLVSYFSARFERKIELSWVQITNNLFVCTFMLSNRFSRYHNIFMNINYIFHFSRYNFLMGYMFPPPLNQQISNIFIFWISDTDNWYTHLLLYNF